MLNGLFIELPRIYNIKAFLSFQSFFIIHYHLLSILSFIIIYHGSIYQSLLFYYNFKTLENHADVRCTFLINCSSIIRMSTRVFPLTRLRGVYPSNSIVKDTFDVVEHK